jgi:hypothetical protein
MTVATIQCHLVSDEKIRRYLWELMFHKNTPFINEVLEQIGKHPELEEWIKKGKLPSGLDGLVKTLYDSLKNDIRFSGQSGRFYSSAISLVKYTYNSWFALHSVLQQKIAGKECWLLMLKSDAELEKDCDCSQDVIRTKATELLTQIGTQSDLNHNQPTESKKGKKTKKGKADKVPDKLFKALMDAYKKTTDPLERCALAYLLKNGCQVSELEEDPEEFATRRRATEIEIERLKKQLKSRIPKGRDLTGEKWLEALETAIHKIPQDEDEAKALQAALMRKSPSVPFPINYASSTDLTWFKNEKGRICVQFNGLAKYPFEIYCNRRQLHWFERFLEDWQIHHDNKEQYSTALFTLCSARLVWLEGKGKGEPWNVHRLILHCSVDTRAWTAEGTELLRSEKIAAADKVLNNQEQKGNLNEKQQEHLRRVYSNRERLNNPFPSRPSKPLYQGQPSILVGVCVGLEKLATVAVVEAKEGKVLTSRSAEQLLSDNDKLLKLLNRRRQLSSRQSKDSKLAQYIDRLLAKAIVAIAKAYQAGSIVLPRLGDIQQSISSKVQARAEQKVPGYKKGQQEYAKPSLVKVHRWSYGRLIESIQRLAAKTGIAIEFQRQSIRGSPEEKAQDLALSAYNSRITLVK